MRDARDLVVVHALDEVDFLSDVLDLVKRFVSEDVVVLARHFDGHGDDVGTAEGGLHGQAHGVEGVLVLEVRLREELGDLDEVRGRQGPLRRRGRIIASCVDAEKSNKEKKSLIFYCSWE